MLNLSQEMIRAKPNSVRWDEINHVKYKFQAFNLPKDLLENLVLSSPPLARRERASTSPERKFQSSGTISEKANEKKLLCGHKSASLDDSRLSRQSEPKRKLSVFDPPSLERSTGGNTSSTAPSCNAISEQQESELSIKDKSCSEKKDCVQNKALEIPSVTTRITRTVAEPSSSSDKTVITNECDSDSSQQNTNNDVSSVVTSPRRQLKKCLSCIYEEDDLLGKSKEELITIIRQLQRQTSCDACEFCRLKEDSSMPRNAKASVEQLTLISSKSQNEDCSRGTQTSPVKVPTINGIKKDSTEKVILQLHQLENKPTVPNQLDMLQSEVQKVYNVSSLFNNELASVQARLSNLILKSEGLSQGFKIMAKESQLDLNHITLDRKISVEGLHALNVINTDC